MSNLQLYEGIGEEKATKVTWQLGLGQHGICKIGQIEDDGGSVEECCSVCIDGGSECGRGENPHVEIKARGKGACKH